MFDGVHIFIYQSAWQNRTYNPLTVNYMTSSEALINPSLYNMSVLLKPFLFVLSNNFEYSHGMLDDAWRIFWRYCAFFMTKRTVNADRFKMDKRECSTTNLPFSTTS